MQGYFAGKLMLICTQTQSMFTHKEEEISNLELKLPWGLKCTLDPCRPLSLENFAQMHLQHAFLQKQPHLASCGIGVEGACLQNG